VVPEPHARIRNNSIDGNGGLAIDLSTILSETPSPDGVTPNDVTDLDAGPNGLQDFPTITGVVATASATMISGFLAYTGSGSALVDVYASPACDGPSGHGEGARHLGSASVDLTHQQFTVTGLPLAAGEHVVAATATGPEGTSEFSACASPAAGTTLQAAAVPGQTRLDVVTQQGFAVGDAVAVDAGTGIAEQARIVAFGSLLLDRPLQFAHAVGAVVQVLPAGSDLAPYCAPVAVSTLEDTPVDVTGPCVDESPATLVRTVGGGSGPVHGTVAATAGGGLRYTPASDFAGADTFTVVARDAAGHDALPATVTVTVTPVDDPPSCGPLTTTVAAGQTVDLAPSCTDVDSATLTPTVTAPPTKGTVTVVGRVLRYTAGAAAGTDTFDYAASDGSATSAPATATVTITEAPPPPSGLTVSVAAGLVAPAKGRAPSVVAFAGAFTLAAGRSVRCGDDVTVGLAGTAWLDPLPGTRFVNLFGICVYVPPRHATTLTTLFLYAPEDGVWTLAGVGRTPTFAGFTSPATLTLTIADDTGAVVVPMRHKGSVWTT
jgi:hypothetical protein